MEIAVGDIIPVERTCQYCGKIFYVRPCVIRYGWGKFCSNKCSVASRKKRIDKICEYCGKEFETWECRDNVGYGRFCSTSCKNKSEMNGIFNICLHCGNEFYSRPSNIKRGEYKFCSHKCYVEYRILNPDLYPGVSRYGSENPNWKGGTSFEPYCELFNGDFKTRVREFFNNKCVLCGKMKNDNGDRNLSVHHVNYNKETCCDNSQPLFVILCMSCHNKTNNKNREYWEDIFTKIINTKYNGKCYYTKEEFNDRE